MDIFAHFLWTYAVYFRNKRYRLLAAFFGVFPDLLAFGPHFILSLIGLGNHFSKQSLSSIPEYVFIGYNISHSLIIFLIVIGIIYFITRKVPIYLGGWLLHILIDIPSHSELFFPTPFLWPISNFHFNGVSWANEKFMIINYTTLAIVYIFLFIHNKKSKK